MKFKLLMIPAALIFQVAGAQNEPIALASPQKTLAEISVSPSNSVTPTTSVTLTNSVDAVPAVDAMPAVYTPNGVNIMEYKSVYEAATLEEEVQLATERFNLSQSQQEIWTEAAYDRRLSEKLAYPKLESKTTDYSYSKDAVYRGLRTSHNTFYETIIGYLSPGQKQAIEADRAILHEKQRRLAKIPPPPPPTVTVAPVDSTALKEQILKEAEKIKAEEKKSKKKKKQLKA